MNKIFDYNLLYRALYILNTKLRKNMQQYNKSYKGISISQIFLFSRSFLHALSKDLDTHCYATKPVEIKEIKAGEKVRQVCIANIIDRIVQGALYQYFAPRAAYLTHSCVYSYQKGIGALDAIKSFNNYVKQAKDLYLIRFDLSAYTDHLLLYEQSDVWRIVDNLTMDIPADERCYIKKLIRDILHPVILGQDGPYQLIKGVPMGTSLTPLIANLYLKELDEKLTAIEYGFYARFGDDVVFAHPDHAVALQTWSTIKNYLDSRKLILNTEKTKLIAFNTSCKKYSQKSPFKASQRLEYLGSTVYADNTLSKKPKSQRKILLEVRQRIRNSLRLLKGYSFDEKGRILCEVLNTYFIQSCRDRDNRLSYFIKVTSNRGVLKHFDYLVALYIAESISRVKGPKAFRRVPYKKIRQVWGLGSLCLLKNRLGKLCLESC